MKSFIQLLAAALLVFALGCSHKKVAYNNSVYENEADGITVQVEWLKNKKGQVDILMFIASRYADEVTIPDSSFSIDYGGQKYGPKSDGELTLKSHVNYKKLVLFATPENAKKPEAVIVSIDPFTKNSKKVPGLKFTLPLPQ